MFQNLQRETVEILSSKAAEYPFGETENLTNGSSGTSQVETIASQSLYNFILDREQCPSRIEADERVQALRKCLSKLHLLQDQHRKCSNNLMDLQQTYAAVAEKTSSLHNACDQMMSQQTQLAAANEQIKSNLYHYQQHEWIMKKLQTSKLLLTGTLFTQILSTIYECISYLKTHNEEKEAELYLQKYEQCLSKSLTAIKLGVLADLESCKEDVYYRQSRSSSHGSMVESSADRNPVSSYVNDDTFALLYGVFGVKANTVRNALSQAHRFFADYVEYQTIVVECEVEYFAIRENLLRPIVQATIQSLCARHVNSSCNLTRDGCSFLLRLCDDEFRLYKQFFVIGDFSSAMEPSGIRSNSSAWNSLEADPYLQQNIALFDGFIEGLCTILYDTLRPFIISNPHLETLTQLCTLIKVEMIEERCSRLMPTGNNAIMAMTGTSNMATEFLLNSRAGFARVMTELVGDIVERIVYRTSLFAQSDVLGYCPAQGDLAYPERLVMMNDIKSHSEVKKSPSDSVQQEVPTIAALKNDESTKKQTSAIDLHCLWYPTVRRTVMCLSKLYKCLDPTVFLNVSSELLEACCQSLEVAAEKIRALPVDSTKATIKGFGRQLDAELFIVKHLLILREQTSPYRSSVTKSQKEKLTTPTGRSNYSFSNTTGSSNILASSDLLNQHQLDYSLDFSKYKHSVFQLLSAENRGKWFELSSNNALLSFFLATPVQVSEFQTDSRRIIEGHLKKYCHLLIRFVTNLLAGVLKTLCEQIEAFERQHDKMLQEKQNNSNTSHTDAQSTNNCNNNAEFGEALNPKAINDAVSIAFKNVKQNWPMVRSAFSLYIGSRETEEILLQPIRKSVLSLFTNVSVFVHKFLTQEQRQIASVSEQEQIWLLLNN